MIPLSVHILTLNSGKTLRKALESVQDAEEILVIDGGSTDDTLDIAQEFGALVIPQRETEQGEPLKHFANARNKGLDQTTQPWVLALDSDEYASKELMDEIVTLTQKDEVCAYFVPRKYVMNDGTVVEHATTYPNRRLYFFHKDAVTKWIKPVHERVELAQGVPVHNLKGASLAPLGTVEDYKKKNRQYLRIESQKKINWTDWLLHKVGRTLRSRCIALMKLCYIWLLPHKGKRLPLRQEMVRFWYAWELIKATKPRS